MLNRRSLLAGLTAASLPLPTWADAGSPAFLAAGKHGDAFVLHGLDADGSSLFSLPLPARGHAATAHPVRPEAVAFARRPGTFALVIDCRTGQVLHRLSPPDGRQFNGHGSFSASGDVLMTSEVVAEGSAGRIGLWDGRSYQRLGEWDSGGIGPHDIRQLPDDGIVIANGGIQTDPDDRRKLNLATMRPNLTLLSATGRIVDQMELDPSLHRNSIRHLALQQHALGTTVAFAMQWEGDPAQPVPLLGLWTPGTAPRLCMADDSELMTLKGYAGSIAVSGDRIALTSAKGGAVMLFDGIGRPVATHRRADLAGVAAMQGGFLASDGGGALWHLDDDGLRLASQNGPLWDNHLIALA